MMGAGLRRQRRPKLFSNNFWKREKSFYLCSPKTKGAEKRKTWERISGENKQESLL